MEIAPVAAHLDNSIVNHVSENKLISPIERLIPNSYLKP